jgi:hypothetical protein
VELLAGEIIEGDTKETELITRYQQAAIALLFEDLDRDIMFH